MIDVADLDCIYLSYDEPKKEEFWIKIRNMVPWAKRVDGVKGSDAAHKAAADASDTERFILIDGDNLPQESFFNETIEYKKINNVNTFGLSQDGTIESFHIKRKKILGIMWHPERYSKFKYFDLKLLREFYATNNIVGR